ncbi:MULTISPECIES: hypothetical protein [Streptomyces]|uniref:hypothetical protein n=1 Tax=Streptomyces TaxID=1883 RepID=UPI00224FE5A3|nr:MULTISPECIES: hypothetical protein [Streptomyces]MCX4430129.1 hypothetical protein [Streptomyces mirabilis]
MDRARHPEPLTSTPSAHFIADWDVARRLARARRVISVALDAQLSEEDNAEIDALCDQGRFYGTDSAIGPSTDQSS